MAAAELQVDDRILSLDGTYGVVEEVTASTDPQRMYNLTVEVAHTFAVGAGQWVVHNACESIPVAEIGFTQDTYTPKGQIRNEEGKFLGQYYTVEENAQLLENISPDELPFGDPIRVFVKTNEMNQLPVIVTRYGVGDPKNLVNGQVYTLDHRRLISYILAERDNIPIQWVSYDVVAGEVFKFTTSTSGTTIRNSITGEIIRGN